MRLVNAFLTQGFAHGAAHPADINHRIHIHVGRQWWQPLGEGKGQGQGQQLRTG